MKVILISGKAQHGKDTSATFIKNALETKGKSVLITHYADLLKYICEKYFDWDGQKDEHGRWLLQYVGTDVVRKNNPNFWVDFVIQMLELFGDKWDYVIIPDARFPNEIDWMKLRFGNDNVTALKVERMNPITENNLTDNQQTHISETALDDYKPDYTIKHYSVMELMIKCIIFVDYLEKGDE